MEKQEREIGFGLLWQVLKKSLLWLLIAAAALGVLAGVYNELSKGTTYTARVSYVINSKSDNPSTIQSDVVTIINAKQTTMAVLDSAGISYAKEDGTIDEGKLNQIHSMVKASASGSNALVVVEVTGVYTDTIVQIAQAYEKYLPDYMTEVIYAGRNTTLRAYNADSDMTLVPNGKGTVKMVVLGGIAGFVLAYVAFFILEMINNKVRGPATLRETFKDIPVLGKIPTPDGKPLAGKGSGKDLPVSAWLSSSSPAISEAYRGLRAGVAHLQGDGDLRVVGLTGVKSDDGIALVTLNLAQSYAQLGKRVLLVEADMRTPVMRALLGAEQEVGISDVLAGAVAFEQALLKDAAGVDVLMAVTTPENPAELLAGNAFANMMVKAAQDYDLVLVSCPAMGEVSDASVIAGAIDGYITVTRAEQTNLTALQLVVSEMARLDMKNIGFVVTDDISKL